MEVSNRNVYYNCIYQAVVVNADTSQDPTNSNRIQIYVPALHYNFEGVYKQYIQDTNKTNSIYKSYFPWATTAVDELTNGDIVFCNFLNNDPNSFIIIGKDIAATGLGYDHAFIIDGCDGSLKKAGVLIDEKDRRSMSIYTTCPAAQIYTGNFVEGTVGKNGRLYHNHESVCIETEDFPDAPNHSDFPCCIASPAKPYYQKTVYKFDF